MFRKIIATLLVSAAFSAFAGVDANQASRAELEAVKGIGPGLSAKILKAREAGSFKSWADLVERVGGIGAGNAARLSGAGLTVQGAGFDASALPAAAPAANRAGAKARATRKDAASTGTGSGA